jgi:hypothetical protein
VLPNWFFIRQTFWNEARRHKLVADAFPKTVYHYTSLAGFIGIAESRSIWMSDFSYLNDSRELIHGAALAKTAIDCIVAQATDTEVRTLFTAWKRNLDLLPNRVCVASFSEDDDSLAQWRAYGPIAIGFDAHSLALHVNQSSLHRVEYQEAAQRKLIDIYLHHLRNALTLDAGTERLDSVRDAYHRTEQLLEVPAFLKNPAFRSENEIRLAYVDNPEVFQSLGFQPLPKSVRSTGGRLVPYVSSAEVLRTEARNFPLEVSEVVIGPESDNLLERGIREFLAAKQCLQRPTFLPFFGW